MERDEKKIVRNEKRTDERRIDKKRRLEEADDGTYVYLIPSLAQYAQI